MTIRSPRGGRSKSNAPQHRSESNERLGIRYVVSPMASTGHTRTLSQDHATPLVRLERAVVAAIYRAKISSRSRADRTRSSGFEASMDDERVDPDIEGEEGPEDRVGNTSGKAVLTTEVLPEEDRLEDQRDQ